MELFKWQLGNETTLKLAQLCIEEQFFKVQNIVYLGHGHDKISFLVNQKFVFQFPRYQDVEKLLIIESKLLIGLQSLIALKIPKSKYIGIPNKNYSYHFHGYEFVSGMPLYQIEISQELLQSCIISLTQFLKSLHNVPIELVQTWGVKASNFDLKNVISTLYKRIKILQSNKIFDIDQNFIDEEIAKIINLKLPSNQNFLVHGDLDIRHLIIKNFALAGIIDWTDAEIVSNVATDLAIIHMLFPKWMHELFFKHYGNVDDTVWRYARFLAIRRIISLIFGGYAMKDDKLFDAAIRSYKMLKNYE